MHMQIPNRNALVIPPKSCPIANRNDEISIAGMIPVLILSLLNRTPLNTSSSTIGAKIIDPMASRIITPASTFMVSMSHIDIQFGSLNPLIMSAVDIRSMNSDANSKLIKNTYKISFLLLSSNRFSMFLSRPRVPRSAQINNIAPIKKNTIKNNSLDS